MALKSSRVVNHFSVDVLQTNVLACCLAEFFLLFCEQPFHCVSVGQLSAGRQEAFEIFRRDYEHNEMIDENKAELRQRYTEAKQLGEQLKNTKTKISESLLSQHVGEKKCRCDPS